MGRILLDFTDIIDFSTDDENQVGLITLRRFEFFDIQQKIKQL